MNVTKRRLIVRFTIQFIFFSILAVVLFSGIILLLLNYLTHEELKRNFPMGGLQTIVDETAIVDDEVLLYSGWEKLIQERGMWLQILNYHGEVIYALDAPEDLPVQYQLPELLLIGETKRYEKYKVYSIIDTFYDKPYFYLLGYDDHFDDWLDELVKEYAEDIENDHAERLQHLEQRIEMNSSLMVFDEYGNVLHTFGDDNWHEEEIGTVDMYMYYLGMSDAETEMSLYYDEDSSYTWLLLTEKDGGDTYGSYIMVVAIALTIAAMVILLLGILFTTWHARQYGQPLFLFVSWLERLGKGDYKEVLAAMVEQKVFTKEGKIRRKYKLYEAVITAFREMAEKLQSAEEARKQLERTREEWMTGISHDLRTPLTSVQGYAHMLESDQYEWSNEELQDIGSTIREKGDYMLQLVEDFSLAFQLQHADLPLKRKEVPIDELVRKMIQLVVQDRPEKQEKILFHYEKNRPLNCTVDRRLFERMLLNLLYNAILHNPVETTITVTLAEKGKEVYIVIRDDGVGMDENTKSLLFERYYRGINTTEKVDGTGLGMSIAKGIVEAHGGAISVESARGQGTEITIVFPIKK
ncbi:HAMP domain-containing sensor histidine kinase [Bacillus sp. JCM 19034]|uniref:sensor histidine kinase n=1 Tax=Bacillus sp. JCM 19034 TaxID=1481928 RepID=UPI0007805326|nr:HAMP domain-containing sensor histidine kinase [Bacillus sp. JCM 19034]